MIRGIRLAVKPIFDSKWGFLGDNPPKWPIFGGIDFSEFEM